MPLVAHPVEAMLTPLYVRLLFDVKMKAKMTTLTLTRI